MHMPMTCSARMQVAHLAVLGDDGVDPVFGRDAGQILRRRAVAGQRQRVRDEPGVLEPLVHRTQVVLGAAEAVDQEHAVRRDVRGAAARTPGGRSSPTALRHARRPRADACVAAAMRTMPTTRCSWPSWSRMARASSLARAARHRPPHADTPPCRRRLARARARRSARRRARGPPASTSASQSASVAIRSDGTPTSVAPRPSPRCGRSPDPTRTRAAGARRWRPRSGSASRAPRASRCAARVEHGDQETRQRDRQRIALAPRARDRRGSPRRRRTAPRPARCSRSRSARRANAVSVAPRVPHSSATIAMNTIGTYVSSRPTEPPKRVRRAASNRSSMRSEEQRARDGAGGERRHRSCRPSAAGETAPTAMTTGATSSVPDEVRRATQTRNVRPGVSPPVATCQAVASTRPRARAAARRRRSSAASVARAVELERKRRQPRNEQRRAARREHFDHAVSQRVDDVVPIHSAKPVAPTKPAAEHRAPARAMCRQQHPNTMPLASHTVHASVGAYAIAAEMPRARHTQSRPRSPRSSAAHDSPVSRPLRRAGCRVTRRRAPRASARETRGASAPTRPRARPTARISDPNW